MQALTKEQKMQMVSDAIDAGFVVELLKHDSNYEQLEQQLPIFKELPVKLGHGGDNKTTWADINGDREFDDNFSATIFI